jgi:hypothetical protein
MPKDMFNLTLQNGAYNQRVMRSEEKNRILIRKKTDKNLQFIFFVLPLHSQSAMVR